ncbi:hypothetical protein DL98DRAFT_520343 [Cadophora sp. DSE1049]|nr:hypothetical protein DL98DRAFT_520343 [Cadophora sp. DSE1049]
MFEVQDYYFPPWTAHQVIAKETYSESTSIITVEMRPQGPWNDTRIKNHASSLQSAHKSGVWNLQVSDYTKMFPNLCGSVTLCAPLPPVEGQDHATIRFLVHRGDDDDPSAAAVHKKASQQGASINTSRGYEVIIPENMKQVVLFANGWKGIAPMLQITYTLLQARADGVTKSRRPEIHVIWTKEKTGTGDEIDPFLKQAAPAETSLVDTIALSELEKLRLLHSDKLFIETVDPGSESLQSLNFLESTDGQIKPPTILQRLLAMMRLEIVVKNHNSNRLVVISGASDFSRSLNGIKLEENLVADRPSIIDKAEQAGWRIMDLSKRKVWH